MESIRYNTAVPIIAAIRCYSKEKALLRIRFTIPDVTAMVTETWLFSKLWKINVPVTCLIIFPLLE